jgi:cytochrome c556
MPRLPAGEPRRGGPSILNPLCQENDPMKQAAPVLGALAVVAAFSTAVLAQTPPADRSIQYRQGVFKAMGWHMGVLGAMAKGDRPYDAAVASRSAKFVNELAAMPWDGFGPGTDTGAPTKAKPEIWKETAKVKQLSDALQVETGKLASAAGGGLDALKGAVGPTGKACSNCHDDFRAK